MTISVISVASASIKVDNSRCGTQYTGQYQYMYGSKEASTWMGKRVGQAALHKGVVGLKVMDEEVVDLSFSSPSQM